MGRNIYLTTTPVPEALERAKNSLDRDALCPPETIAAHEAAGRVTAKAVHARCSSPTFHAAAMDGIAVRAEDTFPAREDAPVRLTRGDGYHPVNTGNPLPGDRNAVIMVENVVQVDDDIVEIEAPAAPWQHVRRIGEDIVSTELLIPQGRLLTPYDVGALLSAGIYELEVRGRVAARFIPTGDEVLDFSRCPAPRAGQVIESNSQVFVSLAREWGLEAESVPVVPDDRTGLKNAVTDALANGCTIVVVGAGSSAGSKDFTRVVFEELGEVLVHGINVMPGKPTLLAVSNEASGYPGRLLVGAPGYPVSAAVCYEELLGPLAAWLERRPAPRRPEAEAVLTRKLPSKPGMEEVVRLAMGRVDDRIVATPLGRGAGMITTLTKAQGFTTIPATVEGLEAGETVPARLLVSPDEVERVLVHVGSHDNILDLLADELMGMDEPWRLVSAHVGSMGGLNALKAGSALFAGCHLFDPKSGDFNFPFLEKYLPDMDLSVVNLAIRHQGLIVPKGNPKGITGIESLTREDLTFINRQRGAGTRILLDHHLKQEGITPHSVQGYDNEEFTHMAVAVNVLTGAADCGMGIMAAARALDLDFVPLARERYDLAIPTRFMDDPRIVTLLDLLRSHALLERIENLGGYETTLTGRQMTPGTGLG